MQYRAMGLIYSAPLQQKGGKMQEKQYELTEKGKKLLKESQKPLHKRINMEKFAAKLLGFTPKKDNHERKSS